MGIKTAAGAVLITVIALAASSASSSTDLVVSGQVRARAELDDKAFGTTVRSQSFTDLRSRLGVRAVVDSNTIAFVQIQDSRRLGGRDPFGSNTSGTLTNGINVDVHQAYVQINHLWRDGPGLKAGRFEVNLANQRVFGSVGWSNVGRSWEGVTVWYERAGSRVEGLALKAREDNSSEGNTDSDIYGVTASLPKLGITGFGFYEYDAKPAATAPPATATNLLDRVSAGFYFKRTVGRGDVELTGVYQLGNQAGVSAGEPPTYDIAAFMIAGEIGYTFDASTAPRIAAGIDYASGDDDPSDDRIESYNNLYYTAHAFRGYMDYFVSSSPQGLLDGVLRGSLNPTAGWSVKADLHYFRTAVDYVDFQDRVTHEVGMELDLTVSTSRVAGVTITGGGSAFFPAESFAGIADPETGLWGYLMVSADF